MTKNDSNRAGAHEGTKSKLDISQHAIQFETIEEWCRTARLATIEDLAAYQPGPLEGLCEALTGGVFISASVGEHDEKGRDLTDVEVSAPKKIGGTFHRFILPVHAAITRVFEIAGARVKMIQGSGGAIESCYFDFMLGKTKTDLHRIWFGVPSVGRLWEQKAAAKQYRYVLPSTYKMGPGVSRGILLEGIRDQQAISLKRGKLVGVLKLLFALADTWHWDELEGRSQACNSERRRLK